MDRTRQSGWKKTRAAVVLFVCALFARQTSQAQIFNVRAGSSSLIDAHGGSIHFQAPHYEGSIGAGLMGDHVQFGGVVRTSVFGYSLTAGDDTIRFTLPTDIFNDSQYFFGRGVGISQRKGNSGWTAFGGTTSTIVGAPFFQAAKGDTPFGLFFMENALSPRLKFVSRSVVAEKQTFINGLEFFPRPWLKTSLSGGIGGNERYAAVGFVAERQLYTLKAAYIDADRGFRRVSILTPLNSEVFKENLSFDFHPNTRFGFTLARQHYLAPVQASSPSTEALVNQASVHSNIYRFRLSSSIYQSKSAQARNLAYIVDVGRQLGRSFEAGFTFNRSMPEMGSPSQTVGGRIREIFGSRFSLTQYVSHANGQTSFDFGGDFTSSRLSVSVSHALTYAPFRATGAEGPFVSVYNVSFRFRPFQGMDFNAQSNVAPDGRVRYTTSTNNYLYRYAGLEQGMPGAPKARIAQYVVKGVVVDEGGAPVIGAALQVNGETVFTDSEGRFLARLNKGGRYALTVLLDDFLTGTPYEVKSGPSYVEAMREQDAVDVNIVLSRVRDPEKLRQVRARWLAQAGAQETHSSSRTTTGPTSVSEAYPAGGGMLPPMP